ncbi:ankyrin repeat domain-containing protein [Streptomyces sp. NPDC059853]|uniref:ankyrin repeat domain-containing protein n=1 Tax=Streptomyces sp. NPDC059853 TaxID=3346973 RepID=UPI0036572FE4
MGFFDGLDPPQASPPPPPPEFVHLGPPPAAATGRDGPPSDWYLPATVPDVRELGASRYTRVLLRGWSVWPGALTLHLSLFRRRFRTTGPDAGQDPHGSVHRDGGLRVGLLLPDGRRVTTLDGEPWPAGDGARRIRLWQLRSSGVLFHQERDLHLTTLPPEGTFRLAVAWPAESVPETVTAVDAAPLRAAAGDIVEVWPDARWEEPPRPPGAGRGAVGLRGLLVSSGVLAGRSAVTRNLPELLPPPARVTPPSGIDTPDEVTGHTPLWEAVADGDAEGVAELLAAGARPWRPVIGPWSPGRLALTTPLAPLVAGLPGAVPLTDEERAAQERADRLIAAFAGIHGDGLGVAFVRGVGEEEAIARLGADPARFPPLDPERDPGPYGTGPGGFDPSDADAALRHIGVTGVEGGCVLIQPLGFRPADEAVLGPLSVGARACALFFNPKGSVCVSTAEDGTVHREELHGPTADSPPGQWLYRHWQHTGGAEAYHARRVAFACARAGLWLGDGRGVSGPPRRWVELPG